MKTFLVGVDYEMHVYDVNMDGPQCIYFPKSWDLKRIKKYAYKLFEIESVYKIKVFTKYSTPYPAFQLN